MITCYITETKCTADSCNHANRCMAQRPRDLVFASSVVSVNRGEGIEAVVEAVNHPAHYGGDTVYETIKVIAAWDLGFCLGNCVKYIARAGKKGDRLEDLLKARFYLDEEIKREKEQRGV